MLTCFCLLGVFSVDKSKFLLCVLCYLLQNVTTRAPQDDSSITIFFWETMCFKLLRTSVLLIQLYKRNAAVEVQCHGNFPYSVCACRERTLCCFSAGFEPLLHSDQQLQTGWGWADPRREVSLSFPEGCVALQALHTLLSWAIQTSTCPWMQFRLHWHWVCITFQLCNSWQFIVFKLRFRNV